MIVIIVVVVMDELVVFFGGERKIDDRRDVPKFYKERSEHFRGKKLHRADNQPTERLSSTTTQRFGTLIHRTLLIPSITLLPIATKWIDIVQQWEPIPKTSGKEVVECIDFIDITKNKKLKYVLIFVVAIDIAIDIGLAIVNPHLHHI